MKKTLFCNAQVFVDGQFSLVQVLCQNGKTVAIAPDILADEETVAVDCAGLYLVPGFLDAHTHGGAGIDVNAASVEQLLELSAFFASHGVTGWLASILTDTREETLAAIDRVCAAMKEIDGKALLGIHLEGPFLAPEYKGAMPPHLLQEGDLPLLRAYQQAANGALRYLTVAPEVPGVLELVQAVSEEMVVALGHSGASYEQAIACIDAGARSITHTFNAMGLFHQHAPGMMGAALERDVYCEAICDGFHLHPGSVRMLLATKRAERVLAVTDSMMAAGLPDGIYKLGVNDVIVKDGDAKLAHADVRAGSVLTSDKALKNIMAFTGKTLAEVLPLLTSTPAAMLRMEQQKGRIAEGCDADYVLLDERLNVTATYVAGREVYRQKTEG